MIVYMIIMSKLEGTFLQKHRLQLLIIFINLIISYFLNQFFFWGGGWYYIKNDFLKPKLTNL